MKLQRPGVVKPLLAACLIAFATPLAGCDDPGPAEQAGEAVDEAAEDARRGVEDATD